MIYEEFRNSLCMAYPGKLGQPLFYRIADYDIEKKCFEKAQYTEKNAIMYLGVFDPTIIGANPDNIEMFQTEIRQWKPKEEDITKQWSYNYPNFTGEIYEIIKPAEFIDNAILDIDEIRSILSQGIILKEDTNETFLMVINSDKDCFTVLKCDKNDFNQDANIFYITQSVKDMLHTKHYFPMYQIEKEKVLSTERLMENLHMSSIESIRYFYCNTVLDEHFDKFFLRAAVSYVASFFSKYFKSQKEKYKLTKNEIRKLLDVVQEARNNENEILEFFEQTGFDYEMAKEAVDHYADQIVNLFMSCSDLDVMVEHCLLNDEDIYKQCLMVIKKQWMSEYDSLREEKSQEILRITEETDKALSKLHTIKDELKGNQFILKNIEEKVQIKEEKIQIIEKRKKEIELEIKQHLDAFKTDIIHATELMGVAEAVNSLKVANVNDGDKKSDFYIKNSRQYIPEEVFEANDISSIQEFCDELSDSISTEFEESMELSTTVIATLLSKKSILISDSVGEKIANAVSALIDASTAGYIFIPSGQCEVTQIISIINEMNSKTIYIDGILNSFNELAFLAINKHCKDKYLFFGVGTKGIVNTLSKNIWNYALYLETESFVDIPSRDSWKIGNFDLEKLYLGEKHQDITNSYKYLRPFVKQNLMTKKMGIDFATILNIYFEMISEGKIGLPLLYAIYLCCKNGRMTQDEYEVLLKLCKVDESEIERLKNIS